MNTFLKKYNYNFIITSRLCLLLAFLTTGCINTQKLEFLESNNLTDLGDGLIERPFIVKIRGNPLKATEVGFENKKTSLSTKKALFNTYGDWSETLYEEGKTSPILVWKNIPLLGKENELFNIYADGREDFRIMYGSVVIITEKGTDAFQNTVLRKRLITKMKLLLDKDTESDDFYRKYWNQINPERAKKLGY